MLQESPWGSRRVANAVRQTSSLLHLSCQLAPLSVQQTGAILSLAQFPFDHSESRMNQEFQPSSPGEQKGDFQLQSCSNKR